jgi:hypothetical protein
MGVEGETPIHKMSKPDLEHLFLHTLRDLRRISNMLADPDCDIDAMGPGQRADVTRTILIKEARLNEVTTHLKLQGVGK